MGKPTVTMSTSYLLDRLVYDYLREEKLDKLADELLKSIKNPNVIKENLLKLGLSEDLIDIPTSKAKLVEMIEFYLRTHKLLGKNCIDDNSQVNEQPSSKPLNGHTDDKVAKSKSKNKKKDVEAGKKNEVIEENIANENAEEAKDKEKKVKEEVKKEENVKEEVKKEKVKEEVNKEKVKNEKDIEKKVLGKV